MMDYNYNTDANESFSHTEIMSVHSGDDQENLEGSIVNSMVELS